MKMQLLVEGKLRTVVLENAAVEDTAHEAANSSRLQGEVDQQPVEFDAVLIAPGVASLLLRSGPFAGRAFRCVLTQDAPGTKEKSLSIAGKTFSYQVHDPRALNLRGKRPGNGQDTLLIKASMAGRVVRVLVEPGTEVQPRDGIVVIEAMKMQNEIRVPRAGRICEVRITAGEMVSSGMVLAVLA